MNSGCEELAEEVDRVYVLSVCEPPGGSVVSGDLFPCNRFSAARAAASRGSGRDPSLERVGNVVSDRGLSEGVDDAEVGVEAVEFCNRRGSGVEGFDALGARASACTGSAGASAAGHGCQTPPGPGNPGNIGIGCKG